MPLAVPVLATLPGDAGAEVVGERPPDALRGLEALQELPLRVRASTWTLVYFCEGVLLLRP